MNKKSIFCMFVFMAAATVYAQKTEWYSTTEKAPWVKESKFSFRDKSVPTLIEIRPSEEFQTMTGFGGCFNEEGWEALKLVSQKEQNEIFSNLFSSQGANFSYNRFPIGASDYAKDFYSFDEVKGDFKMEHFSIARDMNCLIPYIKKAQSYNPQMTFFASPWCPPSWMKTNENYASL